MTSSDFLPQACANNWIPPPSGSCDLQDAAQTKPEQLDAIKPDVAVIGAPWDDSTTNRPGARFGPRALRANAYDPGTHHLDLGVEIFDHLNVVDYGDAITSHGVWEKSRQAIYDRGSAVTSRGIIPVVLGAIPFS